MPDDDIFGSLPVGNEDKTPGRKASKKARKPPLKKPKKKRYKKVKQQPEPNEEAVDPPTDPKLPQEAEESETRVAQAIDRSDMGVASRDNLPDTLPKTEDPVIKAKREVPAVARWDKFLSWLSRGTMAQLYEMGISGLEEGERPLVSFRRSDLLKPVGRMLDQHVDELESGMAMLDLALGAELPGKSGAITPGQKLPGIALSPPKRTAMEITRRKRRSTM